MDNIGQGICFGIVLGAWYALIRSVWAGDDKREQE
jgi:hypothetical protein